MNITTDDLMKEGFRIEKVTMGPIVTADIDYETIHGFDHLEEIEFGGYMTDPSTIEINDSDAMIKYTLYKNGIIYNDLEFVNIKDIVKSLREFFEK